MFSMFSEFFMVLSLSMLVSQSSSLWSSLIIIPFSVLTVFSTLNSEGFSGLPLVLYFMIFVGGLLILLVSVSSLSFQEQNYNLEKTVFLISSLLILMFFFSMKTGSFSGYSALFVSWFEGQVSNILLLILIVCVSLTLISKMISSFKGLIRVF